MFGSGMATNAFYQPYMQGMTSSLGASSMGSGALSGLGGLFRKFSFSGLLNGASKTLNVVNQAIPIFYQVKPMVSNAKTVFRIAGAMKESPLKQRKTNGIEKKNDHFFSNRTHNFQNTNIEIPTTTETSYQEANPTFFI